MHLTGLDWAVIILYFVVTITIGLSFSHRAGRGVDEFFLAGRKLPWWLAGASMVATMFASDTPLFHSGNVRDMGLSAAWLFFFPMFGALAAAATFARLVRRTRVVTDAEFIELRYSGKTPAFFRGFLALYSGIFVASLTMGWVTLGMVEIISQVLGWPKTLSTILLLSITVLYSMAAGLWGVVMTDLFQYIIASLGSVFLAFASVYACGGLEGLRAGLASVPGYSGANLHFLPTTQEVIYSTNQVFLTCPLIIAWILVNSMGQASSTAHQGQRVLACRTEKDASLTYVFYSICYYALNGMSWVVVGLASVILLGATNEAAGLENSQRAFPAMITRLMPDGLRGLMMASLFAAFMSTVSVLLNWGSSYLVNDMYRRFLVRTASQKHYVWISRMASLVVAVIGGLFCLQFTTLSEYFSMVPQFLTGAVVVLLARYLWWRTNIWSEVSAMVSAPIIGFYVEIVLGARFKGRIPFVEHLPGYAAWYSENAWLFFGQKLLTTVGLTTLCWLSATLLTKPTDMEKLKRFYLRVRPPGPGWQHVRRQFDNPPPTDSARTQLMVWITSILFVLGTIIAIVEVIRGHTLLAGMWAILAMAGCIFMSRGLDTIEKHAVGNEVVEGITQRIPDSQPLSEG